MASTENYEARAAPVINRLHGEYHIDTEDFQILSTIRYDPRLTKRPPRSPDEISQKNFFLFEEHVERLKFTCEYFANHTEGELDLEVTMEGLLAQLVSAFSEAEVPLDMPYKVRLLVGLDGESKIELHSTADRPDLLSGLRDDAGEVWHAYVDSESTLATPFTSFKTTYRSVYTNARQRSLPGLNPGHEEVILVNSAGEAMEGSITNFALKAKNDHWITPQLTSGCLCGVTRHFLLYKNFIKEETVLREDLKIGADLLLFNGIMGVVRAKIVG